MSEQISIEEIKKAVGNARQFVREHPLNGSPDEIDMYCELLYGLVLMAEHNYKNQTCSWEIAPLAEEFIDVASRLENYDESLNGVYSALSRMADLIENHPRLKLRMLLLEQQVVNRIECISDHELNISDDIQEEIDIYERNIALADGGRLDEITEDRHLKRDPVEWTARWEEVIDDVEREVYEETKYEHRGMGFCLMYWMVKEKVLLQKGIVWRSPSQMNPHVLFD